MNISQTQSFIEILQIDTLKSGMKTIKNMPEQLINTVDEVVGGLTKVFHSKNERVPLEASKVGASIDVEVNTTYKSQWKISYI